MGAERDGGEKQDTNNFDDGADEHDGAALVAVGSGAGKEREQKQRDELDEADHADQEGALIDGAREAGDGVNLPAEGDAFGLDCEGREDAGGPQEGEGAELEDGRGI